MTAPDGPPLALIGGDDLKQASSAYLAAMRERIDREQHGLPSIFDKWFARIVGLLNQLDPAQSWEAGVAAALAENPEVARGFAGDFLRFRLFLDRWRQGRFVDFASRDAARRHYNARYGSEFGGEVFLTCQGAPRILHWRGEPLMKTAFDFAIYPALLEELRPQTVFEIGSGSGASAVWIADNLALRGVAANVHSVDIAQAKLAHPGVTFYQGDCERPDSLFPAEILQAMPHPWLVIEDAHHNVAAVIEHMHRFLTPGDYLFVEDSEIKRADLAEFTARHPGCYLVDTRYTDFFGRNATCAGDSIFIRASR